MSKYGPQNDGTLDAAHDTNGDREFKRVRSRIDPAKLLSGELADGRNIRLVDNNVTCRGAVKKLAGNPILTNDPALTVPFFVGPLAVVSLGEDDGIFCATVYVWPQRDYTQWLALFSVDRCYLFRPDTEEVVEVEYESGELVTITDLCSATCAEDKIYLFRGTDKTVLSWDGDTGNTFDHVPNLSDVSPHPLGGSYLYMPNAPWGVWAHDRMAIPYGNYDIIMNLLGNLTAYDPTFRQFRINYGKNDWLVGAGEYREDQLIVGFARSMHLVTGLSTLAATSLGAAEVITITEEAGLAARRSLLILGDRVFWIFNGGAYGLMITDDIKLKGIGEPLNWDIDWFDDVNWSAISNAYTIKEGVERVGFVVPVGAAERPNQIFWYNVVNQGWESRDTFPNGLYLDNILEYHYGGKERLVAISRAGGVYLLHDMTQKVDEFGGTGETAVVAEYDINWMALTREYHLHEPVLSIWSRGQCTIELDSDDAVRVTALARNPNAERQVALWQGNGSVLQAIARFQVRLRGYGLQLRLESEFGRPSLRQCSVDGRAHQGLGMLNTSMTVGTLVRPAPGETPDAPAGLNPLESFNTAWATTTPGESITLPLRSGYTYDFTIDWGDGFYSAIDAWDSPQKTHAYANTGAHLVRIWGTCPTWYFNNAGDKTKVTAVTQWGNVLWSTGESAFYGCSNLASMGADVTNDNINALITAPYMFAGCALTSLPVGLTLAALETGTHMFAGCAITALPGGMILGVMTTAAGMFLNNALTALPASLTLASLITGDAMFESCNLSALPVGLTLSNLASGARMFYENSALSAMPAAMLLGALTNGDDMFNGCAITALPSGMVLGNLATANGMFASCGVTSVPATITFASLSDGDNMFAGGAINKAEYSALLVNIEANSSSTFTLDAGNSDYNNAGLMARRAMINDHSCVFIDGEYNDSFNTTWVTISPSESITLPLRSGYTYNFTVDWGDTSSSEITAWDDAAKTHVYASAGNYTVKISGACQTWYFNFGGDRLKITAVEQWGSVLWSTGENAFYGCENLTTLADDCADSNIDALTDARNMFSYCNFGSVPGSLTFHAVTQGYCLFNANSALTNLGNLTLDAVIYGSGMFQNCSSLSSLPNGMTFDAVTTADNMFYSCSSLSSLPSGMTLNAVTNGGSMFQNCSSLSSLPSGMTCAALVNANSMFRSTPLVGLPSGMLLNLVTTAQYMCHNCTSFTSLPNGMTLDALTTGNAMFYNTGLTVIPSTMTLAGLTNGLYMFGSTTLSTASYSQLLVNMEANNSNSSVTFDAGNSKYNSTGETARSALIADHSWSFTDGGLE